jgi:hypothetical protein
MVIDPQEWLALMHEAKQRNELRLMWEEFEHLLSAKDLGGNDEALETAHCAAVEAADIAAQEAYIAAFNETYDREHRETYAALGHPILAAKHTPDIPAPGTVRDH